MIVLVFGSNLAGIHGAGAAKIARQYYGARLGVGHGRTGNAYALPTKDQKIKALPLFEIEAYVDEFIEYANASTDLFKTTRIGCGLAGYKDEEIAPMFVAKAPGNCGFDPKWEKFGLKTWEEVGISD